MKTWWNGVGLVVVLAAGIGATPADAQEGNASRAPTEVPHNLVKILRTSNKAQTNRYIPKVYEFRNVNPYAVVRFVRRVMEIEEGAWVSYAAPDLQSGKILVVFPEYQEPYLDDLMASLDRTGLTSWTETARRVHQLKHRNAAEVDFLSVAELEGTPNVRVLPDGQINAVFLEDTPSGMERLLVGIERLDQPTPQLEARVTVYEVDVSDDGQLGLDYVSWKNGPGRNLFALGAFAEKEKISTLSGPNALLYSSGKGTAGLPGRELETTGRNAAYWYNVPSAYFDFLVAKGRATVLTRSKLAILNRSPAILEVGDEILYYQEKHNPDQRAGARLSPLDPYGDTNALVDTPNPNETTDALGVRIADYPDNRVVVPSLAERALGAAQTGFFMTITPTINQVGCTIDIVLSMVQLTGFSDDGAPVLASRDLDTLLKIPHDRREITIGGMVRQRRVDSANKMPWLGDIPVLGSLFGGESRLDQKTMVVVTLQTEVIDFGDTNLDDDDRRVERTARREENVATPANEPGFLSK